MQPLNAYHLLTSLQLVDFPRDSDLSLHELSQQFLALLLVLNYLSAEAAETLCFLVPSHGHFLHLFLVVSDLALQVLDIEFVIAEVAHEKLIGSFSVLQLDRSK